MTNYEVFDEKETKRTHIINNRKSQMKFLMHIIMKEDLENVIITGQIKAWWDILKKTPNLRSKLE